MTSIGKVWTAGIAYVALAVGAGLSIMYNVVDTMAVRGIHFDIYDLITAVAAPGIVVLMVEMFVSRWWIGRPWYMQIIRATSCAVIGGIAMRASWTHGHDFMASRGQTEDVATMWPLAIDLLAIMATALILAGRTRGHVATMAMATPTVGQALADALVAKDMATVANWQKDGQEVATGGGKAVATVATGLANGQEVATLTLDNGQTWTGPVATDQDVAESEAAFRGQVAAEQDADMAMATQPLSEEYAATLAAELDAWGDGRERAPRTFATKVPIGAKAMIEDWEPADGDPKELDAQVAAQFGKSIRTARRWRSLVTGAPTSSG